MRSKILVADDDPGIRDILKIIFEREGYAIELKEDGIDILADNFTIPDLFLVDKQLSGVDGLDVCRYLKNHESTKNIPVIIISAAPDLHILAQKAGADGHIEKPFEMNYLLEIVKRYITLAEEDQRDKVFR